MVTTMQAQPKDLLTVSTYGGKLDVISLAQRIKIMVPGGNKLTDNEAQALAQVSLVTKCNPFIGEIWYIPGRGPMIGIKGARRHGNEHIEDAGGKDAFWVADLSPCSGEEAGYKGDIQDLAAAYKCVVTDSVSTGLHQRMFLETVNSLRAAGSKDPVGEAREIVGKRPQWVEYGFSTVSETSKMNKQALARKRAEAAALKLKFDIPFGADVAVGDDAVEAGDWVDAKADNLDDITPILVESGKRTKEQNLKDLGYEPETVNQETGQEEDAIELIDPMGDWSVKFAAKEWNVETKTAAQEIGKKKLGHRIEKQEFIQIVRGEPEAA